MSERLCARQKVREELRPVRQELTRLSPPEDGGVVGITATTDGRPVLLFGTAAGATAMRIGYEALSADSGLKGILSNLDPLLITTGNDGGLYQVGKLMDLNVA